MPSTMHSNSRPLIGSLAVKTLSVAVASMALFSSAYAAGLGKLTVLSSLGQPLRAEIELTSISADEQGALVAKLASAETFGQANIEFNPALLSLRFAIEQRGQRQFIRLTSSQPLNEPFVDMLMELTGPNGRLIREYTFLLDPAEMRPAQPVQVAPNSVPAAKVAQTPQAPVSEPRSSTRNSVARATNVPSRPSPAPASDYTVQKGDTLSKIAERTKPDSISLDQMLVALYQVNPEAFIDRNMNRLRAGEILSVPDAETTARISNAEARTLIVAQAADFNAYRSKLADQVGAAAPQQLNEARQSASGKITTQVEERPTPASAAKDKLTLSSPAAAQNNPANAVPAEDLIAREKALAEANARVQELEKNISELQKLLEVKNQGLAEQQNQAEAPKEAEAPAATPVAPATPAEPMSAEANKAEPAPVAPPVVAKPKPAPAAAPVAPVAESSFIDELLANPLTLPGIGALLVVLGGLGIYRARRQKRSKQFEDSIITDSSLKANSLFGSTGGQSVDTNNSVFNSGFATSANQLDSNEVDPVAEADVYIAYGRDAQAEEILKEAMRTQPERHAVRVKLLEIYSNRKDLRAFEVLATELYGLTKGEGDEWTQAAAMGMAIDPQNPLYAGAKSGGGNSVGASALNAPTQPLDEQGLATLLSVTQSDTSEMTDMGALETDTSYFSNTSLTDEKPLAPVQEADPEMILDDSSNEMDFNLDEMSDDLSVPNTIPRPEAVEPSAELASIDFDFLDVPKSTDESAADTSVSELAFESVTDQKPAMEFTLDDAPTEETSPGLAPMDFGMSDTPAAETSTSAGDATQTHMADEPMDFDLSGISLELDPAASTASPELSTDGLDAGSFSSSAEMATKLDLAIAYQEIGDKEGARELLDEVMKGGSPEQSEKAKNLLLELA